MQTTCLIDAHVHIYPHYDVPLFLNAAWDAMARIDGMRGSTKVLMLTETAEDDAFARLADGALKPDGWTVQTYPDDPTALKLSNGDKALLLIAGRQIVTAERLEVHALATRATFTDGQGTQAVLDVLRASQTPAVLPWGVGKWLGKRGKIVDDLTNGSGPGFLLGDNGGRPIGWPAPKAFGTAKSGGIPVLPGSDPLPILRAERDVGTFGAWLEIDLDPAKPGASIGHALYQLRTQPTVAGRRKGLLAVIKDQRQLRSNRQN